MRAAMLGKRVREITKNDLIRIKLKHFNIIHITFLGLEAILLNEVPFEVQKSCSFLSSRLVGHHLDCNSYSVHHLIVYSSCHVSVTCPILEHVH